MDTNIHTRALLVWLTISTWSARKFDKSVTLAVNRQYNATSDATRVNKLLFPGDAREYKELVSLAASIRQEHYKHTLAWSDEGWRLLPTANYMQYTTWYRDATAEFGSKYLAFEQAYPTLYSNAQNTLGPSLFKHEDYPSVHDMRKRFAIDVKWDAVPAQGDIRVDLASDQIASIEATITNRVTDATRLAMADAWERLYKVVEHIREKLSDPEAIFRDTLVSNAVDVCESLKRLNIGDDPNLEAMRARVAAELTRYEPEVLRDEPAIRKRTADKAQQIMSAMAGLYNVA